MGYIDETGLSSEWTVQQLNIHVQGIQRLQTSVMIGCSSFCGTTWRMARKVLVCTVFRHHDACCSLSFCTQLDFGLCMWL